MRDSDVRALHPAGLRRYGRSLGAPFEAWLDVLFDAKNNKSTTRPRPAEVGEVRIRVVRGPKRGKWCWRGRRKGQRDAVWTGWATRDEAMAEVLRQATRGLAPRAQNPPTLD